MKRSRGHFIAGRWTHGGGEEFSSINPATGETEWQGVASGEREVDAAVTAARGAAAAWASTPVEDRIARVNTFAKLLEADKKPLAEMISRETGKPRWESLAEVGLMVTKAAVSIDAYKQRCATTTINLPGGSGAARFKPHGVVAVFGPFNLPGHLPNGHIMPALIAGNTVVFKPSELTPGVAEITMEHWQSAGLPPGVINLVQGARTTGVALAKHPQLDGLFFTGSVAGGLALRVSLADRPQKILALEMGGNNPLVVHEVADIDAAAYETIQSAYISAGQRCTCARRLIVPRGAAGDAFIQRLLELIPRVKVGPYTDEPEPFMGPLISVAAMERALAAQDERMKRGAVGLTLMRRIGTCGAFVSPGLIDVTAMRDRPDAEIFGPLLQLIRVNDFETAIDEANNTALGLSAGLFSDRRDLFDTFYRRIRAGVVNWNRQLTNASGKLPFGGVGLSGNHRPSGYFAADYCSYPVATIEAERLTLPEQPTPGFSLR